MGFLAINRQFGFNPLPAVGLGDTWSLVALHTLILFQSAPSGWAGRYDEEKADLRIVDLFQSAPSGWAGRYPYYAVDIQILTEFQSAPSGWAGRYLMGLPSSRLPSIRFNPLPAVGLGDTSLMLQPHITSRSVSIRSQRLGWEIPCYPLPKPITARCFNPLPAVGLGDTASPIFKIILSGVSIRSQRLGWEIPLTPFLRPSTQTGFNPLPAVGLGDTRF